MVHGDVQPLGSDTEPVRRRYPLPSVFDGFLLEVVTEGEVAEHLEEGVVTGGMADLLQVVVLAARPDALLAGHRARVVAPLEPLEHPLELHHPCVGEQQCGVVRRDERGARHRAVPPGGSREVVEKLLADGGGAHAGEYSVPQGATERLAESYLRGSGAPHSASTSPATAGPPYPRRTRYASKRRLRIGTGRSAGGRGETGASRSPGSRPLPRAR